MDNSKLIADLVSSGQNFTVSLTGKDLLVLFENSIDAYFKRMEARVISNQNEIYLSPKQVSEKLAVDLSTLWAWNKKGYLTHTSVGGKRRYKMSEVNALLEGRSK